MSRRWIVGIAVLGGLALGAPFHAGIVLGIVAGAIAWLATAPPQITTMHLPQQQKPAPPKTDHGAIVRAFLRSASAGKIIDEPTSERLIGYVSTWEHSQGMPIPGPVQTPVQTPAPTAPQARVAASPTPRPAAPSTTRTLWERISSDFNVHALAYTGVLLVFIGTLGLVLFAFGGVNVALRPVAEALIPIVLFGSSYFLGRRGASYVALSLELLGGLVTPIVLLASFSDGSAFPPDLGQSTFVLVATLCSLLLAGGYAFVARKRPRSTLGYLVAPLCWTAVGTLGLAFEGGPSAAQMAMVAVAITASLVLARNLGGHLRRPTMLVSTMAAPLAQLLTLMFAAPDWPPLPIATSGIATLISFELCGEDKRWRTIFRIAQPLSATLTLAAVGVTWGAARTGAVATSAFWVLVAVAEKRRESNDTVRALSLAGAAASLLFSFFQPWTAVLATLATGLATITRRWDDRLRFPIAIASFGSSLALAQSALDVPAGERAIGWGAVAVGLAALTRLHLPNRILRINLAIAASAASLVGVLFAGDDIIRGFFLEENRFLLIGILATAIFVVALTAPGARHIGSVWYAWLLTVGLAILASMEAGIAPDHVHLVGICYGSGILIGALALDDFKHGRRQPGEGIRTDLLIPPAVLGTLTAATGLALTNGRSDVQVGSWCLFVAAVAFVAALQLRAGVVTFISYSLGAVAYSVLLPSSPLETPLMWVVLASVLMGIAGLIERTMEIEHPFLRWDVPPFWTAQFLLLLALVEAPIVDQVAVTWSTTGALLLAIGAWRGERGWPWAITGAATLIVGSGVAGAGWLALTLGAICAVSAFGSISADRVRRPYFEAVCVATAIGTWLATARWADLSHEATTLPVALFSLVALTAYLFGNLNDPTAHWPRLLGLFAFAAVVAANVSAILALPERHLLISALLVSGIESAVAGVILKRKVAQYVAPLFLLGAWLLFATESLTGEVQWITVPSGATALAIVELARWNRTREGADRADPGTDVLEYAGLTLLLGPGLLQSLTDSVGYAFLTAALGLAVLGWGALTMVKRRALTGAATIVASAFILVVVPLARLLPRFRGPALWVTVAVVGLGCIALAGGLEKGRARVAGIVRALNELTHGWE